MHKCCTNKKEPLYIKGSQLYGKESTGFEPARPLNTGSPDFESGALPLCQLSKINYYIITSFQTFVKCNS